MELLIPVFRAEFEEFNGEADLFRVRTPEASQDFFDNDLTPAALVANAYSFDDIFTRSAISMKRAWLASSWLMSVESCTKSLEEIFYTSSIDFQILP